MAVGTAVIIVDKDGQRVVELDSRSSLPVVIQPEVTETIVSSGDNATAAVENRTFWTPQAGKRIHLFGVCYSSSATGNVKVVMGGQTIIPPIYVSTNVIPTVIQGGGKEIWVAPSGDAALQWVTNIAGNHSIFAWGVEV